MCRVMLFTAVLWVSAYATASATPPTTAPAIAPTTAPATAPSDSDAAAAANAYLKQKFAPRVPRQAGLITSDAIAAAYLSSRFFRLPGYFGGAFPPPQMVKETVVLRVDADLKVTETRGGQELNAGLTPPTSQEQARTAAAAVMSLLPTIPSPPRVKAADVTAEQDGQGWRCTAKVSSFSFLVRFDAAGTCVEATSQYAGPHPP